MACSSKKPPSAINYYVDKCIRNINLLCILHAKVELASYFVQFHYAESLRKLVLLVTTFHFLHGFIDYALYGTHILWQKVI